LPATSVRQAVGLLPGGADYAVAVNLRSAQSNESLLSYVSLSDLVARAKGVESPAAVVTTALIGGAAGRTDSLAIAATGGRATFVAGGSFAEAPAALRRLGAVPSEAANVLQLSTSAGPLFFTSPMPGFVAGAASAAAASGIRGHVESGNNLTAPGTPFASLASRLTGASPDVLLYLSAPAIRRQKSQMDTATAMVLTPFLAADGMLVAGMPGTVPGVELHAIFGTAAEAEGASAYLRELVTLGLAQAEPALEGAELAGMGEEAQQLRATVRFLKSVQTESSGKGMTARGLLRDLPSRQESREALAGEVPGRLEQALRGELPVQLGDLSLW
jgi:hypothetical protein